MLLIAMIGIAFLAVSIVSNITEKEKRRDAKMEKICKKCGEVISEGALFCSKCGEVIERVCLNCGNHLEDEHIFCPKCGAKYGQRGAADEQKKNKASGNKKGGMIIGIVTLIILLLGGIGGYYVYQKVIVPSKLYEAAEKLLAEGNYDEAISGFTELGDYKDCKERISEVYYTKGKALAEENNYYEAMAAFEAAGNYADALSQIAKMEALIAEEEEALAYQKVVDKLKKAYDECVSSDTRLSSDGLSIIVDSEDENDYEGLVDVITIIAQLGLPDSLFEEMISTTALMGKQVETYDDYEVSWSYHPDNGLDVIFKVAK